MRNNPEPTCASPREGGNEDSKRWWPLQDDSLSSFIFFSLLFPSAFACLQYTPSQLHFPFLLSTFLFFCRFRIVPFSLKFRCWGFFCILADTFLNTRTIFTTTNYTMSWTGSCKPIGGMNLSLRPLFRSASEVRLQLARVLTLENLGLQLPYFGISFAV